MSGYNRFLVYVFLVCFVVFSSPVLADNFIEINVKNLSEGGGDINIEGHVYNQSNTSQGIAGINVTGTLSSNSNSSITSSDGSFNFNITAPSTAGEHTIIISTNDSTILNKTIPIFVSEVSLGSISYENKKPPFSAGSEITINITLKNSSNMAVQDFLPEVDIFETNGKNQTSWTIENLSTDSGSSGIIAFNVTIPSGTAGQYAIVVERGAIFSIFEVSSGYILSVGTETTDDEKAFNFAQDESVKILTKIRNTNGDPQSATNVKAYVTLPDKTTIKRTLSEHPNTSTVTYTGYYNNTFPNTTQTGDYKIRVKANVSGNIIEGQTMFRVKPFSTKLSEEEDFFFEWGGKGSLKPGDVAKLNILIFNLTNGESMTRGVEYDNCSSTYFDFVGIYYPNGTQVSGVNGNVINGQHMIDSICDVNFSTPTESGVYGVRVNVTIDGYTDVAEGYFAVQNYFLKAKPVNDMGGEKSMETTISPGENVTLSLYAFNLTSETEVGGSLIQDISVTNIKPLEFTTGVTEGDMNENENYWVSGEGTSNPEVIINVPSSILGPALVEVTVNISGETVTGNAFFISNYVEGFLMASSGGEDMMEGPPSSSCEGVVQFMGMVEEVSSGDYAQGVVINRIIEARDEFTGKDVSQYLSISSSTPSDSSGQIMANITFSSSHTFSGFYFILLNVTYHGNYAGLPAGVFCKKLNFWPRINAVGSDQEDSWRIAPNSGIIMSVNNVTRLNDTSMIDNRSYIVLERAFNFNPSKGGENMLMAMDNLNFSFDSSGPYSNVTSNNVSFSVYPSNFSMDGVNRLTKWPSGFIDMQPSVCSPSIGGCDTGFSGFEVVSFDIWPENWGWSSQYSTGENVSVLLSAKTNISSTNGFSVKIGKPWEGDMSSATIIGTSLIEDGWNDSSDWGTERWQVNFTVPIVDKGGQELLITANNTRSQTTDVHLWTSIVKYKVNVPYEEGIEMGNHWVPVDNYNSPGSQNDNTTNYGWNLTYLQETYSLNSSIGRVCLKDGLISTRYGNEQETIVYDNTTKLMIMDNGTGDFDTLVLNNSGVISVLNNNQRNFTVPDGTGGLYLWAIEDCGWARVVNTTSLNQEYSWGGRWEVNTSFIIPLIVYKGSINNPNFISNATLGVSGIGKQKTGGMGFDAKLSENKYDWTGVTTDQNGFGFLTLNISTSGRQKVFWNLTYESETDTATFDTAVEAEVSVFRAWGQSAFYLPNSVIDLYYMNSSQSVWEATDPYTPVYNGTLNETTANGLIRDGTIQSGNMGIHFIWEPDTNLTYMDDDDRIDSDPQDYIGTINFINGTSANFVDGPNNPSFPSRLKIYLNGSDENNLFYMLGCNLTTCANHTKIYWSLGLNGTNSTDGNQETDIKTRWLEFIDYGAVGDSGYGIGTYGYTNFIDIDFKTVDQVINFSTNATPGSTLQIFSGGEGNRDQENGNLIESLGEINSSFDVRNSNDYTISRLGVSAYRNTSSGSDNKMTFAFYQEYPEPSYWGVDVSNSTENITVKVCAQGFDKPNPLPKEGAEVVLKMVEWGFSGPSETTLTMYDPINNSAVNKIILGPAGCSVFNVSHPTGWPSWCNSIEGTATYGGATEDLFVTEVCSFEEGGV